MVQQGFFIGNRDWYLMVFYDINEDNLFEVYKSLLAAGCPDYKAQKACMVLSGTDNGYTYTNFEEHLTLIFIGKASSYKELYDTIQHELRHSTDHIAEYYRVVYGSEDTAYLQGEIARNMFPAVAFVICPMCHDYAHISHSDR